MKNLPEQSSKTPSPIHSKEKNNNRELIHTLTVFFGLATSSTLAESPKAIPEEPLTTAVSGLYQSSREKIERTMGDLDAPHSAVRTQATKTIVNECADIMLQMNPLPSEIDSLFPDPERSALKKRKGVSLEKTMRLAHTGHAVRGKSMMLPDTILAGEYECDECIRMIEYQMGFQIQIRPDIDKKIFSKRILIEAGKNGCAHVLGQISRMAGVEIRFDADPRILWIVPQEKTCRRILSSGKIIGLMSDDDLTENMSNVELRMSPRSGALISVQKVASSIPASVSLAPRTIPHWVQNSFGRLPERLQCAQPASADNTSSLRVTCGVARFPQTVHLTCNTWTKIGFQSIHIGLDPDDPTKINVETCIFPELAWLQTESSIDTQMYGAADANRYRFFNEAGEELSAKTVGCTVNQRSIHMKMQCDGRMHSGEVTAYTQLSCDEDIIIPLPK